MRVLIKEPYMIPKIKDIELSLEELHKILDCQCIEAVFIPELRKNKIFCYIDESGKLKDKARNFRFSKYDYCSGTAVFMKYEGEKEVGLSACDIQLILDYLETGYCIDLDFDFDM